MDRVAEFPGLREGTYLNSCSYGLLSRRARAAIERHLDLCESAPDWGDWTASSEAARAAFARLIGARPQDVAFQANATTGIASVMSALPAGSRRKRIVTLDIDFPTSPFLAERQRTRGFEHTHVRADGFIRAEEWARNLGDDVALACIPAVASFTGYRLDVKAFVAAAHAKGVPVLVDGFQGCGTFPIDVRAWDADFFVTGVYKWLMGGTGLAFLYVRPDHQTLHPTTSGWQAAPDPYKFDPYAGLAPDARRFQYGGQNVLGCVTLEASLSLLGETGLGNVDRHNGALVDRVIEGARERKWDVLSPESAADRASIVTFRVPNLERALAACAREKVAINPRLGGIRVSPHLYNGPHDIDRLFAVLDAA